MTLLSELKKIDQMHESGEISQEEHDRLSAQAVKKYQPKIDAKIKKIAVAALIIALIGWVIPATTTTSTNQTIGLNIIVNNTNLAPSFAGESTGTGQRLTGVTYFNNNTDIELFAFSHGNSSGQTSEIHLLINGTKVADTSGRPLGVAEQNNRTIIAVIPRYSSYKLEFTNYHHYEWREYLVLSGNITSNINISDDDSAYINKTGDIVGNSFRLNNSIVSGFMYFKSHLISLMATNTNSDYSLIEISDDTILFNIYNNTNFTNRNYWFDDSGLDMDGRNINDVNNITESGTINFTVTNNTISFLSDADISKVLINETGGVTSNTNEGGYLTWAQFVPTSTFNTSLLSLNIASYTAGANMRMAIYNDNGSIAPTALLSQSSSQAVSSTGWNNISIPTITINSSSRYWLGFQTQNVVSSYYCCAVTDAGKYKVFPYGSFPALAGSTLNSSPFNMRIYADGTLGQIRYCLRATYSGTLYTVLC